MPGTVEVRDVFGICGLVIQGGGSFSRVQDCGREVTQALQKLQGFALALILVKEGLKGSCFSALGQCC